MTSLEDYINEHNLKTLILDVSELVLHNIGKGEKLKRIANVFNR